MKKLPLCFTVLGVLFSGAAYAQDDEWEIGITANVFRGNGEPSSELSGYGLLVRVQEEETPNAKAVISLDIVSAADFERPNGLLGLPPPIDATMEYNAKYDKLSLAIWTEKVLAKTANIDWFWKWGAGASTLDVDEVMGTRQRPGDDTTTDATNPDTFRIRSDIRTEYSMLSGLGFSWALVPSLNLVGSLDVQFNLPDWTYGNQTPRTSTTGNTPPDTEAQIDGRLDPYITYGLRLGLTYGF